MHMIAPVKAGTEIGRMADEIMKAGKLFPDDLMSQILGARLDEPDTDKGVIFERRSFMEAATANRPAAAPAPAPPPKPTPVK